MGRAPCCENVGLKKGRWTIEEDEILIKYIQANGEGSWRSLPKNAGLLRCGKSCRLRWINYLRTDLKRGNISPEEKDIIIKLHSSLGNRWSLIAAKLPGRTDNEIKNYWNSHLRTRIHSFKKPIKKNNLNISTSAINISQKGSFDRALTMATLEMETLKEKKSSSQEEERGSHEGFRVLSPYDNTDSEVLRAIFNEERESGPVSYYNKGSNEERESRVLSSNSECNELSFSSSMSSCFDDEWVDWDWEGCEGNNIWKKGLWESEDGGVRRECD